MLGVIALTAGYSIECHALEQAKSEPTYKRCNKYKKKTKQKRENANHSVKMGVDTAAYRVDGSFSESHCLFTSPGEAFSGRARIFEKP